MGTVCYSKEVINLLSAVKEFASLPSPAQTNKRAKVNKKEWTPNVAGKKGESS